MKKMISFMAAVIMAANIAAGDFAYVARQDGKTVYMDITELSVPPRPGQAFKIIESSEELKSYKGESLGEIYKYGPSVKISDVQPKFAAGLLDADYKTKPGQKLQLDAVSAQIAPAVQTAAAPAPGGSKIKKVFSSKPLEGEIIASAVISSSGKDFFVTATYKNISVISFDGKDVMASTDVSAYKQILTLSAAPLKNNGRDQIFVITSDTKTGKTGTLIYEFDNNKLIQTDTLGQIAKAVNTPDGVKVFAQDIFMHNDVVFAPVKMLEYDVKKGFKYQKTGVRNNSDATAFSYNTGDFNADGKPDGVFAVSYGKIKIYLSNGKTVDVENGDYASSPVRFTVANKVFRVLLEVPSFKAQGKTFLAAAENLSKIGMVSGSFGLYKNGRINFFYWDGYALKEFGSVDTDGVVYDLSAVKYNGAEGVLATSVYPGGVTVLEIYALGV